MQETIPWTNGSGNIYLTHESGSGNDTVVVSSDINDLDVAREQTLTFRGETGLIQTVIVRQKAKAREVTIGWHPTGYDAKDKSYYSLSSVANGYTDSDSTSCATISLTRGKGAITYLYYEFDTSSIPEDAVIVSVACTVKCYISSTNNTYITTSQVQLFSGANEKGMPTTVANNTTIHNMDTGEWTVEELRNIRLRVYGVRGQISQNTNFYFRFYGATLSVTYMVGGEYYYTSEGEAYVTSDGNYYNCK